MYWNTEGKEAVFPEQTLIHVKSTSAELRQPSWAIPALCRVRKVNRRLRRTGSGSPGEAPRWSSGMTTTTTKKKIKRRVQRQPGRSSGVICRELICQSLLPIPTFPCLHKAQVCSWEAIEFHHCTLAAREFVSRHFQPGISRVQSHGWAHSILWELGRNCCCTAGKGAEPFYFLTGLLVYLDFGELLIVTGMSLWKIVGYLHIYHYINISMYLYISIYLSKYPWKCPRPDCCTLEWDEL